MWPGSSVTLTTLFGVACAVGDSGETESGAAMADGVVASAMKVPAKIALMLVFIDRTFKIGSFNFRRAKIKPLAATCNSSCQPLTVTNYSIVRQVGDNRALLCYRQSFGAERASIGD
jgi:hypothetical protein